MNRFLLNRLGTLVLATVLLAPLAWADSLTKAQEEQLKTLDTLLRENPEIIDSLVTSVQRHLEQQKNSASALEDQREWMNDARHPALGNLEGERVLVVFNDYNCPFCKRLEPVLEQAMQEYPDLKVINVFLPLRQQSVEGLDTNSAQFAMQVWQDAPGKFPEVHRRLMDKSGMHTARSLRDVAKATDTEAQLERSAGQGAQVQENYGVFTGLGLRGTPSLVAGDEVVPGFVPYERLKPLLEQAR
ncbi:DsbA family protein [Marinimicrobium sp. C6131]|uniref:DsbA family protein n=1 Tax=Marinimicrobium sp. C6131 TaxID=3022676 RepID=UPI00223CC22A|nr:DsbA family protein [Marinimicrobium sp. C6131]UZJ43362.1 DsbA family protein [Marinimicrobium sp. C6131]